MLRNGTITKNKQNTVTFNGVEFLPNIFIAGKLFRWQVF